MVNNSLIEYINSARKAGLNDNQIKQKLISSGWPEQDVNDAIYRESGPSEARSGKLWLIPLIIMILLATAAAAYFCIGPISELIANKEIGKVCNLKLNPSVSKIDLQEGVSLGLAVTGFYDNQSISWQSLNSDIAGVNPLIGSSVTVAAKNKGLTRIIVTDNSVGPNCTISIPVNVTSYFENKPPIQGDECAEDIQCTDGDSSTKDICSGTPKKCFNTKITSCLTGDNYCPPGCDYNSDKDCEQPTAGMIDCGSNIWSEENLGNMPNFDCFITAAQTCTPAKLTNTATMEIFGMISTGTGLMEIKEMEGDKCVYYTKTLSNSVKFSDELIQQMLDANATQEQISQEEQMANENAQWAVGKDSTCKYPIGDLVQKLEEEKDGNFSYSSEDAAKYQCTGTMYG